jgi:hypothetical protein
MLERFGQRAAIRTAMASLLMQGKSRLDESLTTSGPAIGPVVGTLFPEWRAHAGVFNAARGAAYSC